MILSGITALVLLVACANFTNLMLARAEGRRREFVIRLALGGGTMAAHPAIGDGMRRAGGRGGAARVAVRELGDDDRRSNSLPS